jgi:ribosome-binding protein aMBF1 (putative translation factor)
MIPTPSAGRATEHMKWPPERLSGLTFSDRQEGLNPSGDPVPLTTCNGLERWDMSKLQQQIARRRTESTDFARGYARASHEIQRANDFMEAIAEHLESKGLSKADLARLVDKNPSAVRKLFLGGANPTLDTALQVAAALDLEITVKSKRNLVEA